MRFLRVAVLLLPLAGLACGDDSPTAPSVVQVGGTWTGTQTLTAVAGGECVGVIFSTFIGESAPFVITITQTGDSLASTYQACSYAGTAGSSSFTLNSTSCTIPGYGDVSCQIADGGGTRDVVFISRTISGTINGNSMAATSSYDGRCPRWWNERFGWRVNANAYRAGSTLSLAHRRTRPSPGR